MPFLLVCLLWDALVAPLVAPLSAAPPAAEAGIGWVYDDTRWRDSELAVRLRTAATGAVDDALVLEGGGTVEGVRAAMDRLLADERVGVIVAWGELVALDVLNRDALARPVIVPAVHDLVLRGVPGYPTATQRVANLAYEVLPSSFAEHVAALLQIARCEGLAVLVSDALLGAEPGLRAQLEALAAEQHVRAVVVPVGRSLPAVLPDDVQAVLVTPLPPCSAAEWGSLAKELQRRRLPSLEIYGQEGVDAGLLASRFPDLGAERLVAGTADRVRRVLAGERPNLIPALVPVGERRLTIAMDTAHAIGNWPSWDLLTEAELIGDEPRLLGRRMTLAAAVTRALARNLDLTAANLRVSAGLQDVVEARAALEPQLEAGLRGSWIDEDRAESSLGRQAERSLTVGLTLEQLLYSEEADANVDIQESSQSFREHERDELLLDTAQLAAVTYLDVLRAETDEAIELDNLALSRSHLALARVRVDAGAANRSEVYRWEGVIAGGKQGVITARVERELSVLLLNRLLDDPLDQPLETAEAGLSDSIPIAGNEMLFKVIDNPWLFEAFSDFLVQEGLATSPELERQDDAVAIAERTLLMTERAYDRPKLGFEGTLERLLDEHGEGAGEFSVSDPAGAQLPDIGDTRWGLELSLTFPMLTGGARDARYLQAQDDLVRQRTERTAVVDTVDQRIRAALHLSSSSFASIRLSQQEVDAASKSLDLVTKSYTSGAVSIVELLDVQNALLVAEHQAADSIYSFLVDLVNVQRAIGRFDFILDPGQNETWLARLQTFLGERGLLQGPR